MQSALPIVKPILALILLAPFCNHALADSSDAVESTWKPATLTADGFEGGIKAFELADGSYRIESLQMGLTARSSLTGTSITKAKTAVKFTQWCGWMAGSMVYLETKKDEHYALDLAVNPTVANLRNAAEGLSAVSVQNPLTSLMNPRVAVTLASDSLSVTQGYINVPDISGRLTSQMNQQTDALLSTGHSSLDLTGYDALACDLAAGKASISVTYGATFDSAKLAHEKTLSTVQYGALYEAVGGATKGNTWTLPILAGARLAIAMEKQKSGWIDLLGWDTFLRIYSAIFYSNGSRQALTPADYPAKSKALEKVSKVLNVDQTTILETTELGFAQ